MKKEKQDTCLHAAVQAKQSRCPAQSSLAQNEYERTDYSPRMPMPMINGSFGSAGSGVGVKDTPHISAADAPDQTGF